MSIIRVKRSGGTGSPSALAQGEMAYSFLGGTQSNGGDRLYIGTGTETGGVAANIEVIGGKYFTSKLSHVPGTLTNNAAVIVDSNGKIDTFTATTLNTIAVSANGSLGTPGQILTSNGSTVYWATTSGTGITNLGQSANSIAIALTSSSGSGTTLAAANSTTAGIVSADIQTIAGAKTFTSTIVGSVSGNAGTATALQTARTINGTSFDGTSNITITAAAPNALTIGTGLSGASYNGSVGVTIAIDSTVATLAGTQTLTNKTLTSPTINGATVSGTFTGSPTITGDLTVGGNLTINGTTTTINATTISVDDKNIELGSVASPTDTTADGGGITLKGATDKTFNWLSATGAWTSSEHMSLLTGKAYYINGSSVLSSTTLGSGVTGSSLTSVGTITSGTWSGSFGAVSGANLTNLTAANLTGTISSTVLGNSTHYIGTTAVTLNRASGNLALTGISSVSLPGSSSGSITLQPTAIAGATTITLPATTGTLITSGDTGTVTNTMLAGSIAITKLTASTISGVSLGNNLNALTIGTGLSGSSYNGSAGVTIAANIATTSTLGIASFDSTNFSVTSGAVALATIDGGTY